MGEKELLGIVEGLKTFSGVIRVHDLRVHTDHSNLLYNKLLSQQMARWKLLLEEYHPKVVHISGVDNNAVDALSILDLTDKANNARVWGEKSNRLEYINVHMMNICMFLLESEFVEDSFDDDTVMLIAEVEDPFYSLDLKLMQKVQLSNIDFIRIVKNHLSSSVQNNIMYTYIPVEDVELVYKNNQILVPRSKQQNVLYWYHKVLIHPGEARMIIHIK